MRSANLDRFIARLGGAPPDATTTPPSALAEAIDRAIVVARGAWPQLQVSTLEFVDHLADHFGGAEDTPALISAAHVTDLYLALGCASGDPRAILAFEGEVLPAATTALNRMNLPVDVVDDLRQQLRSALLVRSSETLSMMRQYGGRGSLRAWVRVAAIRHALTWQRSARREHLTEDLDLLDAEGDDLDPELAYMKELYRREFRQAFEAALATLDAKRRTVLRLHVLDGLNIGEIGSLYRVHRATVARWIASSREELLARTRDALSERLALSTHDFDSLLRLVESQLDVSLARLLVSEEAELDRGAPSDGRA